MPMKTRASSRKVVKQLATDAIKVSGEIDPTDTSKQVDRNTVLKSKEVSKKPLSKKKSKRAKATPVKAEKHIVEYVDEDACIKPDSKIKDQCCSADVTSDTSPKPVAAELDLSHNEEPPEDFSFGDARQQALKEEEHVKQYLANIQRGIKRQRHQQNERYKLQKMQKQSDVFSKLPDNFLAQISLKKTQRKRKMSPTPTKKRRSHAKAKIAPADQRIAVRKLTEDTTPVAASYETAVQFRDNRYYGGRHNRISARVMDGRKYKFTAPPSFTVH